MDNYKTIIESLTSNDLLNNLNYDEHKQLTENSTLLYFKSGEIIVKQDEMVTSAIYISGGTVKKEISLQNRLILLDIINSDNFIALPSTITNEKHQYSIIALDDTFVCFICINKFKEIITNNGNFGLNIIYHSCNRQKQLYNKLLCFSKNNVYGRLAYTILYFSEEVFKNTKFNILITRNELSQLIGLSRESLIKGLSALRKDKIIFVQGKHIEIIDYKRLQTIAERG